MATWQLGPTSAAAIASSPNTQLVLARLAITTACAASSQTWAWPYVWSVDGTVITGPQFPLPAPSVAAGVCTTWAELNPY